MGSYFKNNKKCDRLMSIHIDKSNNLDKRDKLRDLIINGKIGSPIKGATLIGDGPSILKEVSLVGNNMMLDPGIGTCGKAGQGVPVGVAQPSILINRVTVGGTQL